MAKQTKMVNGVKQTLIEGVWRGEGSWLEVWPKVYDAHRVGDIYEGKQITEKPYLGKAVGANVVCHFRLLDLPKEKPAGMSEDAWLNTFAP